MRGIPKPATPEGYFIPTLNEQGFMSAWVSDEYMQAFIDFSCDAPGASLDIGAAYGIATLEVLKKGAKVIANDLSREQLNLLKENTPNHLKHNLTILPGRFPDQLNFEENSLGSILIARVLHFFSGEKLQQALKKCFQWLSPGGKLFLTAETPYLKNLESFIPEYEKRISANQEWPGHIDNFKTWDQRKGLNLPSQMHLLDDFVLERELKKTGFKIIKAQKFARPEFPESLRLDGRESVGVIAQK